jgi:hypothetical protein
MAKLQPIAISDKKPEITYFGLTEDTFYKQIDGLRLPVVYLELPSNINIEFRDGILTIITNGNTQYINLFSKTVVELVQALRDHSIVAYLVSDSVATMPVLFVENSQSLDYINIKIDKSPIYIGDFNTLAIRNIPEITSTNPTYNILKVFDSNKKDINFNYVGASKNLFVDSLGTAIMEFRINKYSLFMNRERLLSTKSLIKYAKQSDINSYEKGLILDQFINTFDTIYE